MSEIITGRCNSAEALYERDRASDYRIQAQDLQLAYCSCTTLATGVRQSHLSSPLFAIATFKTVVPAGVAAVMLLGTSSHNWGPGNAELPFQSLSLQGEKGPATATLLITVDSSSTPVPV